MNRVCPLFLMTIATGCSPKSRKAPREQVREAAPSYQVDPLTAGSISGMIRHIGKGPSPTKIDMRSDPACVEAYYLKALDEFLVLSSKGELANAFVYVKSGWRENPLRRPQRRLRLIRMGAGSGRASLVFRRARPCRLRTPDAVTHSIHPIAVKGTN